MRDGISYSEQEKKRALVNIEDIAALGVGECYILSSMPEVRLAKISTPEIKLKDKNEGFVQTAKELTSKTEGRVVPRHKILCNKIPNSHPSDEIEKKELGSELTI